MSVAEGARGFTEIRENRVATSNSRRLKFYRIEQVAEILETSTRSVRRLIADGKLPVHRFGRSVRVAEADLRSFIALHRIG